MDDHQCVAFAADCHVRAAVELVSHVWDPVVLSALRAGPMRRNDLIRRIAGVSDKALTEALRRTVDRGLIRRVDDARPAAAVYELTALGASFAAGPLVAMAEWAAAHQDALVESD